MYSPIHARVIKKDSICLPGLPTPECASIQVQGIYPKQFLRVPETLNALWFGTLDPYTRHPLAPKAMYSNVTGLKDLKQGSGTLRP